jgi:hypothetical protein
MRYVFVDSSPNHVQMEVVDGELWIFSGTSYDISTIISPLSVRLFFCYYNLFFEFIWMPSCN